MQLNHKILGEGRPLYILHGLFGSLDNWATMAKRLAEERQVVLVDQRNHGRSPHSDEMSYPHMVSDLVALMDELGHEQADILGHSMGGKTVLQMAYDAPERIARMIVADIGPWSYQSHHDAIFEALFAVPIDEVASRGAAMRHMREHVSEEGVLQFLAKNLYWIEKGRLAWRMNLPLLHSAMDEILSAVDEPKFNGPTLFLRGSESGYITEANIPELKEAYAGAQVVTMEGVGHWLHAEDPKTFFEELSQFFGEEL